MEMHITTTILLFALFLLLAGLLFAVLTDSYMDKDRKRVFWLIILSVTSLVAQNFVGYLLDVDGANPVARTMVDIYGYCVRPMIILLFCHIVDREKRHRLEWMLVGLNVLVSMTAMFSDVCFTIDDHNRFHRGPLGYTCHMVSGVLLIYLLWLTLRKYRDNIRREAFIPVFNVLAIIVSVILDSRFIFGEYPATFLTVAVVISSVFDYIWLHLQFVREHEKDLAARQRIQIMMTQIQPHFLYNTIATFRALCTKDPAKASEVAYKFGAYLRQNMESLDAPDCIPFEKELVHTKLYTNIEMVRFDHIRVDYDIEDDDFDIPPLSVQPLVENAIRHGVRIREEGIVKVMTRRRIGYHEIIIEDNGVGFDTKTLKSANGSHIGIRNVRERIEKMCKGSLSVESKKGEGVVVKIRIPMH